MRASIIKKQKREKLQGSHGPTRSTVSVTRYTEGYIVRPTASMVSVLKMNGHGKLFNIYILVGWLID